VGPGDPRQRLDADRQPVLVQGEPVEAELDRVVLAGRQDLHRADPLAQEPREPGAERLLVFDAEAEGERVTEAQDAPRARRLPGRPPGPRAPSALTATVRASSRSSGRTRTPGRRA
jgi:hypothetical protein